MPRLLRVCLTHQMRLAQGCHRHEATQEPPPADAAPSPPATAPTGSVPSDRRGTASWNNEDDVDRHLSLPEEQYSFSAITVD